VKWHGGRPEATKCLASVALVSTPRVIPDCTKRVPQQPSIHYHATPTPTHPDPRLSPHQALSMRKIPSRSFLRRLFLQARLFKPSTVRPTRRRPLDRPFFWSRTVVAAMSSASSNSKRKRSGGGNFYAVKVGDPPAIYYSWPDAEKAVKGVQRAVFKRFETLTEAESFMAHGPSTTPTAKPSKSSKSGKKGPRFYGVQVGRVPGVYTDWDSTDEQVRGFPGGKQKGFTTWEGAQAFVDEATRLSTTPISLNGHLTHAELGDPSRKKQKRNDGSAADLETNGDHPPGTGPLPPDAADGFDRSIKLAADGTIAYKDANEMRARKPQADEGDFTGYLEIYTDGASRGNGRVGAVAGVGIWFGPNHPQNEGNPLPGERQTNQRAELAAMLRALEIAPIDRNVAIFSDSHYSIQCVKTWYKKWETNQWKNSAGKDVENKDLIRPIRELIENREKAKAITEFVWVKGHSGNPGNVGADKLATEAADREIQKRSMET
jgi:ribonuclease HI